MKLGLIFAICAGLSAMGGGVVTSHAAKKSLNLSLIQGVSSVFLAILTFALAKGNIVWRGDEQEFWINFCVFLAGAGNFIVFLLLERAMRYGHNGLIWSIVNSALIFPFLMGIVVFGVDASVCRWLGAAAIVAGIFTAKMKKSGDTEEAQAKNNRACLLWTLAAFISAGITQSSVNIPSYLDGIEHISNLQKGFVMQLGMISAAVATLPFMLDAAELKRAWKPTVGMSLFLTVMNGLFLCVFLYSSCDMLKEAGAGAIAYPVIVGVTITAFSLYSIAVLKEKLSVMTVISMILTVCGVVMVAL